MMDAVGETAAIPLLRMFHLSGVEWRFTGPGCLSFYFLRKGFFFFLSHCSEDAAFWQGRVSTLCCYSSMV